MWVAFGHHPECTALDSQGHVPSPTAMVSFRRATIAAAGALASFGLAYRFALAYRVRAGYPRRNPPQSTPADLGLDFETMLIESDGIPLPAWFIPARGGAPGPGVVLVHGWESARDRTLPMAVFLHAAGFHCLTFDVRGNGDEPSRGPAAHRRRVRRRLAGGLPRAHRATRGHGRGDRRPLDGRRSGRSWRRLPIPGWPLSWPPRARSVRIASRARRSGSPVSRSPTSSPIRWPC